MQKGELTNPWLICFIYSLTHSLTRSLNNRSMRTHYAPGSVRGGGNKGWSRQMWSLPSRHLRTNAGNWYSSRKLSNECLITNGDKSCAGKAWSRNGHMSGMWKHVIRLLKRSTTILDLRTERNFLQIWRSVWKDVLNRVLVNHKGGFHSAVSYAVPQRELMMSHCGSLRPLGFSGYMYFEASVSSLRLLVLFQW